MADAAFYSDMQNLAVELLTFFGKPLTIRRRETVNVTPAGDVTESAPSATTTVGALLPKSYDKDNAEEYASLTGKEVRCLIIAAKGMAFVPRSHDECVDGADVWHIESATPLNPAGTPVYHRCPVVKL